MSLLYKPKEDVLKEIGNSRKSLHTDIDFRILEYIDHFRIEKRERLKIYWNFLGLCPLFVKEIKDVWYVILKDKSRLCVRNCFEYDRYQFKTKEECLKWIEDYKKYPIHHYL